MSAPDLRLPNLDRDVLRLIAQEPGISEKAAWYALRYIAQPSDIESLIERGLLRRAPGRLQEGRPLGLYLTDAGWRALEPLEKHELDVRLLLYIAENPGCTEREAVAAGDDPTRLAEKEVEWGTGSELEYRRWRVDDFFQLGLVRREGQPSRDRLYLTYDGRRALFD